MSAEKPDAADALRRENAALRKLLGPFARYAEVKGYSSPKNREIVLGIYGMERAEIRVRDFAAVRSALQQNRGG